MDSCNYKYMDSLFLDEYKAMDSIDSYSEEELRCEKFHNAVLLPCKTIDGKKKAGVVDENGNYVALSAFEALSPVDCWGGAYELKGEPKLVEENVMYMGRFWKHWGHFIMDLVSRLWYAIEVDKTIKIAYDGADEISGNYLEFMRLAGIDKDRFIRVDEPTRFASVIVPEVSYKPGISCNLRYKKIFDVVASQALSESKTIDKYKDKRIYFTRTGIKMRFPIEIGEKDVEMLFADNDYLIISPEKHSLVDQITMVRVAKEIACVAGTLPHNMMFAENGANLVIIRKTNKPNYRQTDVNRVRNLHVTNVDAHISLKPVGAAGPFIIDVNGNVEGFFKDRGMKFSYNKILGFWKKKARLLWYIPLYIVRNRKSKPQVPIFDGDKFVTRETARKELFSFYIKRV